MVFKILEERTIEFQGKQRNYQVTSRDVDSPAPPCFITYNNGTPIISEEVRANNPRYEEPMVVHELAEFEKYKGQKDPCLNALKLELERVDLKDLDDYVEFRLEVLKSLKDFLLEHTPDSEFLPELEKSIGLLKKLYS